MSRTTEDVRMTLLEIIDDMCVDYSNVDQLEILGSLKADLQARIEGIQEEMED